MQPWRNGDVVKHFHALLVIQAYPGAQQWWKNLAQIAAYLEIVIADAKPIVIASGNHALDAKPETVELIDGIRLAVRNAEPAEDAKALRRILLFLIQVLIEVVIECPRAGLFLERGAQERATDERSRVLAERSEIRIAPSEADQLVTREAEWPYRQPNFRRQCCPVFE